MGAKLLVVILVAAVVVGGVGYYLYQNMQEEGTGSDYSLLDEDKIAQGLVCKTVTELDGQKTTSKALVHSVISGNVTYTVDQNSTESNYKYRTLDDFTPNIYSEIGFDYTDSSAVPTGVIVTSSGNTYTINGTKTSYSSEYKYDSLKIVYDGTSVTSVNGKYTYTISSVNSVSTYEMTTTDGVYKCNYNYKSSKEYTTTVSEFFNDLSTNHHIFIKYDPSTYSGLTVKVDDDYKYDGIKVTKYTVSGTDSHGVVYKDFEVYVYKGYQIKMDGKVAQDGEQHSLKLVSSIYMDD